MIKSIYFRIIAQLNRSQSAFIQPKLILTFPANYFTLPL